MAKPLKQSTLELGFLRLWRMLKPHLPEPAGELAFCPPRKFRFDFAWVRPGVKLAVELHGGQWQGGRHVTGQGLQADCEKARIAVSLGWRVLPFTTSDMKQRPVQVIEEVARYFEGASYGQPALP